MSNYVVYHLHSDLSNGVTNIDSVTKYNQYVDYAKSLGMKAMGFSEHGSVFSWVKKKNAIENAGMKYIHAEEFYVTETLEDKIRDNYHCVLIAANYDGVLELNALSSKAFDRKDGHYYYAPRITMQELKNTSDNIIITTACLGGALASGTKEVQEDFLKFLIDNKHRCYLEIQHHYVRMQMEYNKYLYEISIKYGIPLVVGTDTHALNEEHLDGRKILQKAKNIYFENENGWDLTFKTYDELVEAYRKQASIPMEAVLEALENTNRIADRVKEFKLDYSYKYPRLWDEPEKLLREKIAAGIKNRGVDKFPNKQEYLDRVEHEMEAYIHNGAIDFMLLMEDVISWCRSQDIPIGYGRGSVNGSIIAWLIGITEMDSIKHGLNFERFMNVERVSLSDVDTDFPPSRIDEVKNYIFSHHGLYCSDIITFNTIADKGAIRDIGRALDIPLSKVGEICDAVDNKDIYEQVRKDNAELFKYVDIVKGVVVSIGNHPCGILVSPEPLDTNIGTCTTATDPFVISQLYMKEVDSLNFVKLDCLKLDTIQLIDDTCKMVGIPMVLPDTLDITDVNVWNSMRDDTTSIFQWEQASGREYIKKLLSDETINKFKEAGSNVDRMTLITIGNSAIRPAGASYRDDLANGIIRTSGSEAIDEFLKPTFGYLVYQCQIIEFLHQYCGFTMGEADIVRRHFAKKTGTEQDIPIIKDGGYMVDEHGNKSEHYILGFIATMKEKYNMEREEAEKVIVAFLQVIIDASEYLFSLNHSDPYSYEGYACGYLRYYHPLEFITCSLNINKDKEEKTIALTEYAKKVGIEIRSPEFGYSRSNYACDKKSNAIYKGISSIKFLSEADAEALYKLKDNLYIDFVDFLKDNPTNSRTTEILIQLDYFKEFGRSRKLWDTYSLFNLLYGKKQIKKDKIVGLPQDLLTKYCDKETERMYKFSDTTELISAIAETYENKDLPLKVRLNAQKDYLGYLTYRNPKLKNCIYVTATNTKYTPIITGYDLVTGETKDYKISVKDFREQPIQEKDILVIQDTYEKQRMRKAGEDENGKIIWEEIPNEYWTFIKKYVVK